MMTKKEQLQQGMLLVDEPTMRRWLSMADCIPAVEAAYAQFSRGETILPPIVSMALEDRNAELDVKTGFIPGCNRIAVKMAAGFYENEKRYGLPSWPALVMVADGDSGFPLAVMDGGYLTTVRTGAAGAVGAKYLARKDAHTVFIMGAGNQARIQLAGLVQVLPNLKKVYVHSPVDDGHFACAQEMREATGLDVEAVAEAERVPECVRASQVIVTVTPSRKALIQREWIAPGTHINAIGSDGEGKQELDPAILRDAKVVADCFKQTSCFGECQHAVAAGYMTADGDGLFGEIGELAGGMKPGRENDDEITVFDATGMAVLDVAAASIVYDSVSKDPDAKRFQMFQF